VFVRLGLKLAKEKHSSFIQKFYNYGCKKFYNICPWCPK